MNRTRAVALATALVLSGLAIGWATAAPAVALEQRLVAPDGAPGDELGSAVAVDGDTAVLGASEADAGRGAVYVFTRVGDAWLNTAKLTRLRPRPRGRAGRLCGHRGRHDRGRRQHRRRGR